MESTDAKLFPSISAAVKYVARSITYLECAGTLNTGHLAEAINPRTLDRRGGGRRGRRGKPCPRDEERFVEQAAP